MALIGDFSAKNNKKLDLNRFFTEFYLVIFTVDVFYVEILTRVALKNASDSLCWLLIANEEPLAVLPRSLKHFKSHFELTEIGFKKTPQTLA